MRSSIIAHGTFIFILIGCGLISVVFQHFFLPLLSLRQPPLRLHLGGMHDRVMFARRLLNRLTVLAWFLNQSTQPKQNRTLLLGANFHFNRVHAHICACVHTHTRPHTHILLHYTYTTNTLLCFTLIHPRTSGNTWYACGTVHCTLKPLAMANSCQLELHRSEIPRPEYFFRAITSLSQHDTKIVVI